VKKKKHPNAGEGKSGNKPAEKVSVVYFSLEMAQGGTTPPYWGKGREKTQRKRKKGCVTVPSLIQKKLRCFGFRHQEETGR